MTKLGSFEFWKRGQSCSDSTNYRDGSTRTFYITKKHSLWNHVISLNDIVEHSEK